MDGAEVVAMYVRRGGGGINRVQCRVRGKGRYAAPWSGADEADMLGIIAWDWCCSVGGIGCGTSRCAVATVQRYGRPNSPAVPLKQNA